MIVAARRGAIASAARARLFASALIEFVHSLLLAPVRMLFHTQFVLAALTGWRLDWKSPPRDDASTPWREAVRRHGVHTLLAIAWIGAILATSAAFPWWLSPILAGLLLAIPLSVYTSRVRIGRGLAQPRSDADPGREPRAAASCARRARAGRRWPSAWRPCALRSPTPRCSCASSRRFPRARRREAAKAEAEAARDRAGLARRARSARQRRRPASPRRAARRSS